MNLKIRRILFWLQCALERVVISVYRSLLSNDGISRLPNRQFIISYNMKTFLRTIGLFLFCLNCGVTRCKRSYFLFFFLNSADINIFTRLLNNFHWRTNLSLSNYETSTVSVKNHSTFVFEIFSNKTKLHGINWNYIW